MDDMQMDHSAELGALAKALASAQHRLSDAKKDSSNPAFKGSRYASLASVRAAVTPILTECGFALVQTFEPHGDAGVCVVTTLLHESGQWIRSRLFLPVGKKDAQGFGSAISYGRRYSLAAIAGIAADDDDDAQAAVGKTEPRSLEKPLADSIELMEWSKLASARLLTAENMGELVEAWAQTSEEAKKRGATNGVLKSLAATKDAQKVKLTTPKSAT